MATKKVVKVVKKATKKVVKKATKKVVKKATKKVVKKATKKVVKKATKKVAKRNTVEAPVGGYREPKRVSIQKAKNGYVVSSYGQRGEVVEVAKSMAEANKLSKKMLEG